MRNRDSLLGRARPADRLTREQIAALDRATSTPAAPPAPTKPTAPPAPQEPNPIADKPEETPLQAGSQANGAEERPSDLQGPQGPTILPLERRLPRLRFQGCRPRTPQRRPTPGSVRPL